MKKIVKFLGIIVILFGLILFIYGGFKIFKWYRDANKIDKLIDDINKEVIISEDNNGKVIKNGNIDKSDPYFDYIKMSLIDVDLDKLKKINFDTVGFIHVNGTNINYPFVKTNNNSYYLNHAFDKSINMAGWVFMDYRNDFDDKNIILYAHGMENLTMFGSLKKIFSSNWYSNKNNHVIKISTYDENSLWQVFSVYKINNTSDYLKINFDNDFDSFIDIIKNRSYYKFNTDVYSDDKILTLSTCYNDDEKMVMHAKLIKIAKKQV